MAKYRLVRTGPTRDPQFEVQKFIPIFGWKMVDWFITEDRAQARMDELERGPHVLREVEGK
jgi:hypothetical protein